MSGANVMGILGAGGRIFPDRIFPHRIFPDSRRQSRHGREDIPCIFPECGQWRVAFAADPEGAGAQRGDGARVGADRAHHRRRLPLPGEIR
eukprot:2687267-Pyramimonas_sp.AAC.1